MSHADADIAVLFYYVCYLLLDMFDTSDELFILGDSVEPSRQGRVLAEILGRGQGLEKSTIVDDINHTNVGCFLLCNKKKIRHK